MRCKYCTNDISISLDSDEQDAHLITRLTLSRGFENQESPGSEAFCSRDCLTRYYLAWLIDEKPQYDHVVDLLDQAAYARTLKHARN